MRLAAGFRESLETPTQTHTYTEHTETIHTVAAGTKFREWVKRKRKKVLNEEGQVGSPLSGGGPAWAVGTGKCSHTNIWLPTLGQWKELYQGCSGTHILDFPFLHF